MYFKLFDNFPYRIYVRDEEKILYANNTALKHRGVNKEDIVGKKFEEVYQDLTYLEHIKRMRKYFFIDKNKNFSSMKELNRCYSRPEMLQMVEYLEEIDGKLIVIAILISIEDDNYPNRILPISTIGNYESASRRVTLHNGDIIKLTSLENSLLFALNKKASQVISYEEIFLSIDPFNKMNKVTLKSLIFRLNKKIHNIIKCESMQGYYIQ